MQETIDIKNLLQILYKKIWFIILSAFIGFAALFLISQYGIDPEYTSSVSMYVNNTNQTTAASAVNINDINASQKLVNTYIVILQDNEVLQQIADRLVEKYSYESLEPLLPVYKDESGDPHLKGASLRGLIRMSAVNDTEVLNIQAETKSPVLSAEICTLMTEIAPEVLQRVVKAGSVEVIGHAEPASRPSSPNVQRNSLIGAMLGIILSVLAVLLQNLLDNTVKDEEGLKQHFDLPVIGEIPDFNTEWKGGYKSYGR